MFRYRLRPLDVKGQLHRNQTVRRATFRWSVHDARDFQQVGTFLWAEERTFFLLSQSSTWAAQRVLRSALLDILRQSAVTRRRDFD